MAGDWIKLQKDTFDKPEVLAIAARLGLDQDAVVGKLCRIWSWFDTHTLEGNADCVTFAFFDRMAGVTGFTEQVALVGWIHQSGHTISLKNFDYHNGETSKSRAMNKNRQEKRRSNANSNANTVTHPLPEKRREEKNNTDTPAKLLPCPQDLILNLYAEKLPSLPQPRKSLWSSSPNAAALKKRWDWVMTENYESGELEGHRMAQTLEEGLDWFSRFFDHVSESEFLSGRSGKFNADLGWLVNSTNFQKVVQGNYKNKKELF